MAMDRDPPRTNQLWIERFSRYFKFDSLSQRVTGSPRYGPFLFFASVYALDYGILALIQLLFWDFHPYVWNPSIILQPLGLIFALWAAQRLRDQFERAIDTVRHHEGAEQFPQSVGILGRVVFAIDSSVNRDSLTHADLGRLVSGRWKAILLLIGWGFHLSWVLLTPDAIAFVFQLQGPIGAIRFFVTLPLVFYVIAVDLASVYLGILLLLPLKLRAVGQINFQDPLGYGNLKPIGDLIKSAALLYMLALGAYILFTGLSAHLAGRNPSLPGPAPVGIFGVSLVVISGVVLFVLPVIIIHGHMKNAKHRKIQELAKAVEESGPPEDTMMFPQTKVPESFDHGHDYIQYFIKITKVENTHEYPIDVSHLQQIILAALVPIIADVTISILVGTAPG